MFQQFPHAFGVFSSEVNRTEVIPKTAALCDFLRPQWLYQIIVEVVRLFQEFFRDFQTGNLPGLGEYHDVAVLFLRHIALGGEILVQFLLRHIGVVADYESEQCVKAIGACPQRSRICPPGIRQATSPKLMVLPSSLTNHSGWTIPNSIPKMSTIFCTSL